MDDLTIKHVIHHYQSHITYMDVFLTVSDWRGKLKNIEEDKGDEIKWFPIDGLPSNMVPEVKLALENIKKNIFYGELGW